MMQRKDIFGNIYTIPTKKIKMVKPMTFEQKLREAKAKEKYRQYQIQQIKNTASLTKRTIQKTGQVSKTGLQKTGGFIKKIMSRATSKRLTSPQEKIRGSIYKKE